VLLQIATSGYSCSWLWLAVAAGPAAPWLPPAVLAAAGCWCGRLPAACCRLGGGPATGAYLGQIALAAVAAPRHPLLLPSMCGR
jgi:hypothetical protein